jgi:hypothetical protein
METPIRQVSRRLHEEHLATLAVWSRVESALAAGRHDAALMRAAAASLLFPRLADAGEADIAALLEEEHATIREAARRFIALPKDVVTKEMQALGLELAERLVSHVQKEEMSLLPALDDLLDEAADAELSLAYAP